MKSISKMIIGAASLLLTSNLFAAPACPPNAMIENAQFIEAANLHDPDVNAWGMITNNFEFDGKTWNVAFAIALDAKTPEEALQEGKKLFKTISLQTPQVDADSNNNVVCTYAVKENSYFVGALTPPIALPYNTKKLFK